MSAVPHPTVVSQVPVLVFPAEALLRGQDVRLAVFDVDGVLTDGGLLIESDELGQAVERVKRFHTLDGLGMQMLRRAQVEPVVVSGRRSPALVARLSALGVTDVHLGIDDKLGCVRDLLSARGLSWTAVAAIGDDWPDLPLLCRAAFACAPPGAHPEVLARVHHVTAAPAGAGAAREFCDVLLQAKGLYAAQLAGLCAMEAP